jgi:predicted small metal-binding protein
MNTVDHNYYKISFVLKFMKRLTCRDVGLDCDFVMNGSTEEEVLNKANDHAWKVHAIKPEEMTSEMKVKIKENIREY